MSVSRFGSDLATNSAQIVGLDVTNASRIMCLNLELLGWSNGPRGARGDKLLTPARNPTSCGPFRYIGTRLPP